MKNSLSEKPDTLTLTVLDESWYITQTKLVWQIARRDSDGSTDTSEAMFMKNEIWLHPPRKDYLRLTELVTFPSVVVPVTQGQVIKNEVTPNEG